MSVSVSVSVSLSLSLSLSLCVFVTSHGCPLGDVKVTGFYNVANLVLEAALEAALVQERKRGEKVKRETEMVREDKGGRENIIQCARDIQRCELDVQRES